MRKNIQPVVVPIGNRRFPRFAIANAAKGFWSGMTWSRKSANALLFANRLAAAVTCIRLRRKLSEDLPHVVKVFVPLELECRSDKAVDLKKLAALLSRIIEVELAKVDDSELNGTIVTGLINWSKSTFTEEDNQ